MSEETALTTTEPTDHYLANFNWNKIRYRSDKPIAELIDTLQKVRFIRLSIKMT